ncbi:hypothetical protein [Algoriphagus aquimarinus]|uniref:Uncharacterized protein n=1 Tax=Algoriphagus aquimarinus TaxID=237018 RepID=A0A1I1BL69_9BACT|nr:hypothetical protein [Algoriphagus aquimarinus]SFB50356.1 hypothetical protein SAMN04489723_11459 [Algoriphagus aquimarinus]
MRNDTNSFPGKNLPKFGISFFMFLGILLSFTTQLGSKISLPAVDSREFASQIIDADHIVSPNTSLIEATNKNFINAINQFSRIDFSEFISSIEEETEKEFFSNYNTIFKFKLGWFPPSIDRTSLEYILTITSNKLFILFHRLKIFY